MKLFTILLLIAIHPVSWSQEADFDELGRSLANYQKCGEVSLSIKDDLMFEYYQKMFNDINFSLLNLNGEEVNQVYIAWDESEKILDSLNIETLKIMCLSRFDELSRKMLMKKAT